MKKTNSTEKRVPVWLVLTIICVVAAGCLAVTNGITAGIIAENGEKAEIATRQKLIPSAAEFKLNEENGVYTGKDDAGNPVGYVTTVKETGFGGEIEVTVAADPKGIIQGISVGGNNFSETAGLGAKSKDPAFQEQFKDKTAPVALSRDGGEIDAITSATITSKAVIRAVNTGMETIGTEAGFEIEKEETAIQTLGGGKYATAVQGFAGPVYVEVTLDENDMITALNVGDESFSETPNLGGKTRDESFRNQFIGKTGNIVLGDDVDAVSGATVTSKAVTGAVNSILLYVTDPDAYAAGNAPAEETFERDELGIKVSASSQGMCGPVAVFMTVTDEGTIAKISIGDNDFCETEYFGERALEPEFYEQFIGISLPVSMDDVDVISGATITTRAVVNAVNECYDKVKPVLGIEDTEEEKEAEVFERDELGFKVSSSAQGMCGPVAVFMTVTDEGTIAKISIGDNDFCETEYLGERALEPEFYNQFIGMSLPVSMDDVDIISGATITTHAVVNAINDGYERVKPSFGE